MGGRVKTRGWVGAGRVVYDCISTNDYFIHDKTHLSQLGVDAPPPTASSPPSRRAGMVWGY